MPRRVTIASHLAPEELFARYRHAEQPIERSHWQIIGLVADGHPVPEVARLVGYNPNWVRTPIRRYNTEGPAGLVDRRRHNPGQPPLLTAVQRSALVDALAGPAPDGGVWTGPKVAAWMAERLGLLPVVRRVWAPKGTRPTAWVLRRYQWLYVYGFVRPTTGQSWWCLLPTVSVAAMTVALETFAADTGIDATHRAVLVLDGAGWHTSGQLVLPEGIDLVFLPPASPELQPAERLWPLIDEAIATRTVATLDVLEDRLATRCQQLAADRHTIQAQTQFHWWPREPQPPRNAQ